MSELGLRKPCKLYIFTLSYLLFCMCTQKCSINFYRMLHAYVYMDEFHNVKNLLKYGQILCEDKTVFSSPSHIITLMLYYVYHCLFNHTYIMYMPYCHSTYIATNTATFYCMQYMVLVNTYIQEPTVT